MVLNASTDDMTSMNSVLDIVIPIPSSGITQLEDEETQKTAITHQHIAILIDKLVT